LRSHFYLAYSRDHFINPSRQVFDLISRREGFIK
jgi:hypothetical protein